MYVKNVGGYNFAFKYRDTVIYIPFDGQIYSIPDDSGTYSELRVVLPINIKTQPVTYINKNGNVASENICGHKRRGRPEKDPNAPIRIPKSRRKKRKTTITEQKVEDTFMVDVDLDEELAFEAEDIVDEQKSEVVPTHVKPKSTVKRPAKKVKPRKKSTDN